MSLLTSKDIQNDMTIRAEGIVPSGDWRQKYGAWINCDIIIPANLHVLNFIVLFVYGSWIYCYETGSKGANFLSEQI